MFVDKKLNETIVDNLTLHFKWMEKHLLRHLNEISLDQKDSTFKKSYEKLTNYIARHHHPLNLMRKLYAKTLTNFLPYYSNSQIQLHEQMVQYQKCTSLVSNLGTFADGELVKRFKAIMTEDNSKLKNLLASLSDSGLSVWLKTLTNRNSTSQFSENTDLDSSLEIFFEKLNSVKELNSTDADESNESNFDDLTNFLVEENNTDIKSIKLIIELLPAFEYFALKSLNSIKTGQINSFPLNNIFFERIQSIGVNELQILKTINSDWYKCSEYLWTKVLKQIHDISDPTQFDELINTVLPKDFYRNYASFNRVLDSRINQFAINSLALRSEICQTFEPHENRSLFCTGASLTGAALSILFDKYGKKKETGLGDLDVWRTSLNSMAQLIWNNVNLMRKEFSFA